MKAIGVRAFGGPEALEVLDLPEPHAGPNEVRIRVEAAAVNPADTMVRSGAVARGDGPLAGPVVPGMDAAGVIDEIGDGPSDWRLGDAVMAIVIPRRSH